MKLVFLKYGPYAATGGSFRRITANLVNFPGYFSGINDQWDNTCRPDPDFHPHFPSTGLCRNGSSSSMQNYLKASCGTDDLVIYYYYDKDISGNIFTVISAVFKIVNWYPDHKTAYNAYSAQIATHAAYSSLPVAGNIPLNIVYSPTSSFSHCVKNRLPARTSRPCIYCTSKTGYRSRVGRTFIQYDWYSTPNNAGPLLRVLKTNFDLCLVAHGATLTHWKTPYNPMAHPNYHLSNGIELNFVGTTLNSLTLTPKNGLNVLNHIFFSHLSTGKQRI